MYYLWWIIGPTDVKLNTHLIIIQLYPYHIPRVKILLLGRTAILFTSEPSIVEMNGPDGNNKRQQGSRVHKHHLDLIPIIHLLIDIFSIKLKLNPKVNPIDWWRVFQPQSDITRRRGRQNYANRCIVLFSFTSSVYVDLRNKKVLATYQIKKRGEKKRVLASYMQTLL